MDVRCKTSVIQSILQVYQEMEVSVQSPVLSNVDKISKSVLARSMMGVGNQTNAGQKCPWDLKARNAMKIVQFIAKMKKSW